MVFTESWFHQDISGLLVELEEFSLIPSDRTEQSGKSRGGGICMFLNESWCRNYTVCGTVCIADVELLCISLRTFYLLREFGIPSYVQSMSPPEVTLRLEPLSLS